MPPVSLSPHAIKCEVEYCWHSSGHPPSLTTFLLGGSQKIGIRKNEVKQSTVQEYENKGRLLPWIFSAYKIRLLWKEDFIFPPRDSRVRQRHLEKILSSSHPYSFHELTKLSLLI